MRLVHLFERNLDCKLIVSDHYAVSFGKDFIVILDGFIAVNPGKNLDTLSLFTKLFANRENVITFSDRCRNNVNFLF